MDKTEMKNLIDTAMKRKKADVVIKNCSLVNVFTGEINKTDIALCGKYIAATGSYDGKEEIDAEGKFACPGFIDSHIHVESSCVSPEEMGRMLIPHGTTTIIADPHEIVNVCGLKGLEYMMKAAEGTALEIKYMLPSCVPATPFENSGAVIDAGMMSATLKNPDILGLGEMMNFPGVINADDAVIEKIAEAQKAGKVIDGHAPSLIGEGLCAYAAAGILADHECSTVEEMNERIANGMYVMLREGSACHNLRTLLKGVTPFNSQRCLLCSDDRQSSTIIDEGHLDNHLSICVKEGIEPVEAVRMATLNAAMCFGFKDKGAIAPGRKADIVLLDDLKNFNARYVFKDGELVAKDGQYLPPVTHFDISDVRSSVNVKDFSGEKLKMHLKSSRVNTIEIIPGSIVTKKSAEEIKVDENGEFIFDENKDIVKISVIERHHGLGNVANGFLKGYGLKKGAVAVSVAHDSHNIIAAGASDEEIEFAVKKLIEQEGGITVVLENKLLSSLPFPIAGLMSDKDCRYVDEKIKEIHKTAVEILGVNRDIDPVMTLCFMSLPVIPEIKITDMGLFDVNKFSFIKTEA